MPEVGLPVGHPQTVVVDLTRLLAERPGAPAAEAEVRLVSTMRVHWDQIAVDTSAPSPYRLTRLDASAATLRWRGFSAPGPASVERPFAVDYSRASALAPWKTLPGLYTRFGMVRPLLAATDDQFVITAPGDEIALRFPATSLPSLPRGWVRSFLLHVDGFSKEMNLRSSSPDRLDPLPFHGMSDYPYPPSERTPLDDTQRRYRSRYNTMRIGGPLPALAEVLLEAPHGAR
jgi:hypothetical protein